MARKATHTGICQACGRRHMLPGGKLSIHGYTVDHGYFNGTCIGSGELPYEQSRDLIQKTIADAGAHIQATEAKAVELRKPTSTSSAWLRPYVSGRYLGAKGRYEWTDCELARIEGRLSYSHGNGWHSLHTNGHLSYGADMDRRDIRDVAAYLNGKYADALLRGLTPVRAYVEDQQRRFDAWVPNAPLVPR